MKTLKILAVLLLVTGIAVAQDIDQADVPVAVKDTFAKEYANASDVEWEKEIENYKVEFDVNRMDHKVWDNASGTVVKKEQDIAVAELPQPVRDAIKSGYAVYRVDDIEKGWQNNATRYELEKGDEDKHLTFDANGKVMAGLKH